MNAELALLDAALEATPPDVFIDADANQGWRSAKLTVATLEKYGSHHNLSVEQPLHYDDIPGARFVRAHAKTPHILDESVWSPERMASLIEQQACDRIVLKLNRVGGFYPALQIIGMCTAAGIGVSVDTNPFNLIGDTASAHLAAVIKDHYPVDCEGHVTFLTIDRPDLILGGVTFDGNQAVVPDGPGLGVEVNWDAVAKLN
jgi:L-alanine-DL-glutamate epimerase-like enolase superfamily enzyme